MYRYRPQEGAFALCFKSVHFPGEVVACRRGSPLLIGIKSRRFSSDHVPIFYSKGEEAKGLLLPPTPLSSSE